MPPRLNYHTDIGPARAHATVQQKYTNNCTVDAELGCWLFNGSTNNDGYGQVFMKKNADLHRTGRSAQTAFLIHRVSFLAARGRDAVNHVSHLCDRPRCFNPDHLADETAQVNNSRKGCPGPIACSVHHHIVVDLCPHVPGCIRPERDDVFCCLSIRESDPAGWATQEDSQQSQRLQGSAASQPSTHFARQMMSRASSEYSSAADLEAAIRAGEL